MVDNSLPPIQTPQILIMESTPAQREQALKITVPISPQPEELRTTLYTPFQQEQEIGLVISTGTLCWPKKQPLAKYSN